VILAKVDRGAATSPGFIGTHRRAALRAIPWKTRVVPLSIVIGTVIGRNLLQLQVFIGRNLPIRGVIERVVLKGWCCNFRNRFPNLEISSSELADSRLSKWFTFLGPELCLDIDQDNVDAMFCYTAFAGNQVGQLPTERVAFPIGHADAS